MLAVGIELLIMKIFFCKMFGYVLFQLFFVLLKLSMPIKKEIGSISFQFNIIYLLKCSEREFEIIQRQVSCHCSTIICKQQNKFQPECQNQELECQSPFSICFIAKIFQSSKKEYKEKKDTHTWKS